MMIVEKSGLCKNVLKSVVHLLNNTLYKWSIYFLDIL